MSTLAHRFAEHIPRPERRRRRWGTLEVTSPVRYGWRTYRLTVYAPGTTAAERRLLALDRNAPLLVAGVALLLAVILRPDVPPLGILLVVPAGVFIVSAVRARARRLRQSTLVLVVAEVDANGTTEVLGDLSLRRDVAYSLRWMEHLRRAELITELEFQRRWAIEYERLAEGLAADKAGAS
ncbi:hypothetical protein EYE40_13700 [Glaciihabitans arcticus]|uniref:Uncharacterized protein n=1 Tax=Glaciihabitans arcticus TaxID=2668039 RepID=A0A4Q9GUC9_9MICO|nr:DUF6611 family protein [Glaciihabitans arcticus]TBN58361.1 hypothetical protein EYE40_13700 [Glaciihabitans arcticus]